MEPFAPDAPAPLEVELVLTRAEAERGIVVPLRFERVRACPACGGSGGWILGCPWCGGAGRVRGAETLGLAVPAGVRSGAVLDVALGAAGIQDRHLRVHVRVRA